MEKEVLVVDVPGLKPLWKRCMSLSLFSDEARELESIMSEKYWEFINQNKNKRKERIK